MHQENRPNFSDSFSEPRFPDLSMPHDLSDPFICLIGIENYCGVLNHTYEKSARRWGQAEDAVSMHYELSQKGVYLNPRDGIDDLRRHSEAYRKVCEQWQEKLCELADACSRAMPKTLLTCKIIKLHPDPLYRKDNGTDWEEFHADLKRLQVEAHCQRVSKQEPRVLAEAIACFLHEVGSMRSAQKRLVEILTMFRQLLNVGEKDQNLKTSIDEWLQDIAKTREKVESLGAKVLATAILPPHDVKGLSAQEWRFRLIQDVREITDLIAGRHSDAKTDLTEHEDKRFIELYQELQQSGLDAQCFVGVGEPEMNETRNYNYFGPVDQRKQIINAPNNSGRILGTAGDHSPMRISGKSDTSRRSIWQWLGKPTIRRVMEVVSLAVVGALIVWRWPVLREFLK